VTSTKRLDEIEKRKKKNHGTNKGRGGGEPLLRDAHTNHPLKGRNGESPKRGGKGGKKWGIQAKRKRGEEVAGRGSLSNLYPQEKSEKRRRGERNMMVREFSRRRGGGRPILTLPWVDNNNGGESPQKGGEEKLVKRRKENRAQ